MARIEIDPSDAQTSYINTFGFSVPDNTDNPDVYYNYGGGSLNSTDIFILLRPSSISTLSGPGGGTTIYIGMSSGDRIDISAFGLSWGSLSSDEYDYSYHPSGYQGTDPLHITGYVYFNIFLDAQGNAIPGSGDWDEFFSVQVSLFGDGTFDESSVITGSPTTPEPCEIEETGTTGPDNLTGGPCSDTLSGLFGNDVIQGLAGDDSLYGGAGADSLSGGPGIDKLHGGDGNDTLNGGEGGDDLNGDDGNDLLYGGPGDDTLLGDGISTVNTPGNDTLYGEAGNDTLNGLGGNDVLHGGDDADVLMGGPGNDNLNGGNGPDMLYGDAGNDLLNGGGGRDEFIFRQGHGSDTITGFEHNSFSQGVRSTQDDVIRLEGNFPRITWEQVLAKASAVGADSTRFDFSEYGWGTITVDVAFGDLSPGMFVNHFPSDPNPVDPTPSVVSLPTPNSAPQSIERGTGISDTLNGSSGSDNMYGEGGNDALLGWGGHDYINGGAGDDMIWGKDGNDGLVGGAGSDLIYGENGNDTISAGDGIDIVLGGEGNDQIRGDGATDGIWAEGGNDTVDGGAGSDFLAGGTGHDSLYGGADSDYLTGEAGNDTVDGGAGYDIIVGGEGNDTLVGGIEGDTFFGGSGADRFIIEGGDNWIMDFNRIHDWLQIEGMKTDAELMANAVQAGDHVHVNFDGGNLYLAWTTLEYLEGWPIVSGWEFEV